MREVAALLQEHWLVSRARFQETPLVAAEPCLLQHLLLAVLQGARSVEQVLWAIQMGEGAVPSQPCFTKFLLLTETFPVSQIRLRQQMSSP